MATIASVTDNVEADSAEAVASGSSGGSRGRAQSGGGAASRRSRRVPDAVQAVGAGQRQLLTGNAQVALIGALVAGLFAMAVAGFNSLQGEFDTVRSDIRALDAKIDRQVGMLRSDMNARFARVDERFNQIDQRFVQIEGRFVQIDQRFVQIEGRLDSINQTLLGHTDRLARIEATQDARRQSDAQS